MEMHQGPSSSEQKLQVKAYAKIDAELPERQRREDCIPVMVSITAPPGMEAQREPLDLVVVLHVRKGRNVPEKWQELLKVALEVVTGKLDTKDCLAVVPFMPNLLPMSKENATALLKEYKPDSIQTDTSLVIALESAESIFNGRAYEDKKTRTGYIVVISNCEDDMNSLITWRFLSVHAFGFRGAHNAWTIHTIASSRDCNYAILDDELGRLTQAFTATIDRITSAIAVMPIEIQLRCNQKVELSGLIGSPRISYSISDNKKNGTIWPRAHVAGVSTNFIVHLNTRNLGTDERKDLSKVLTVHAKYYQNPGASQTLTTTNFPQGQDGTIGEVLEGKVEVVTITEGMYGSKEVAAEIVRLEAVRIIHEIIEENKPDWDQLKAAAEKQRDRWTKLEEYNNYDDDDQDRKKKRILAVQEVVAEIIIEDKTDWEKLRAAADKLRTEWTALKDSKCGQVAGELISSLSSEIQEMEIRLYNNYMWPEYLLSWKSHQWWQLPLPPLFMDKLDTDDDPLLRLRIVAKVDDIPRHKKGLPVLVSVMAPEVGLAKVKRVPVDVVAVLDTENKTNKKQELLIKAMEVIMDKLGHQDRIAIIPVQTANATQSPPRFMDMSKQGRRETAIKLSIMVQEPASPDTGAVKLSKFIKFITNCFHIAPTNSCIPNPTSSGSDVVVPDGGTKLWKALKDAVKLLDERRERDRLGFIIVISDGNGDFIRQEILMPKYTVHAFGFHESGAHNIRSMHYIANSSSDGIYAVIDDHLNQVTIAFTACINKIISTIVVATEVGIVCRNSSSEVALSTIDSGKFSSIIEKKEAENHGSIFAGALYVGAVRNFIVYVKKADMLHEEDYANFSKLFTIHIKWFNVFSGKEEKLDGQVVIARGGTNESKEISDIIVRFKAIKIINKVTNPNYNKTVIADKLLNICHGNSRLVREIQTMEANLRRAPVHRRHRRARHHNSTALSTSLHHRHATARNQYTTAKERGLTVHALVLVAVAGELVLRSEVEARSIDRDVEAEPERRTPVPRGRGDAGGGGAGVLRRRCAQAPHQALPQRALRRLHRRRARRLLPPGARQAPGARSPHREAGVRGRQGGRGVRGDGVLQGPRLRWQAAPHDGDGFHQDGQAHRRLVRTLRGPGFHRAPCFFQRQSCHERVDPVGRHGVSGVRQAQQKRQLSNLPASDVYDFHCQRRNPSN